MFDLNNLGNEGAIFNNGIAGRVKNVVLSLEKKDPEGNQNAPDIKFVFTDKLGSCNLGWYRFTKDDSVDEDTNKTRATRNITKLVVIARAILPTDFEYPSTEGMTATEVENLLLGIIAKNTTPETVVNIFACYGYTGRPGKYLQPRAFNFIERAETPDNETKLVASNSDVMTRIQETASVAPSASKPSGEMQDDFWA